MRTTPKDVTSHGWRQLQACRICGSAGMETVLDLGEMPLANSLVEPARAGASERRYPLHVVRCPRCGLVQLGQVVAPEVMFREYPYASSASAPLAAHFAGLADDVARRFGRPRALAVEIGSNDGVLLRAFRDRGIRAVGIEPASNLAEVAVREGLETWNEFLSADVARRIASRHGPATVVIGTNVLAHIDDLHGVLESLNGMLVEDGVFIAEVPYLGELLDHVEYDTIYHEHLSYFSLAPLIALFASADMEVIDIERLAIHGGSIRVFASRIGMRPISSEVEVFARAERRAGLMDPLVYRRFSTNVEWSRELLQSLVSELRRRGLRIAAHGATAKGSTLLNHCDIGPETIDFIADSTPYKQGMLSPGKHIPIVPEDAIQHHRPDYTVLLAWNYADAIVGRHAEYIAGGGRFVHPIPFARVLQPS